MSRVLVRDADDLTGSQATCSQPTASNTQKPIGDAATRRQPGGTTATPTCGKLAADHPAVDPWPSPRQVARIQRRNSIPLAFIIFSVTGIARLVEDQIEIAI